MRDAQLGRQGIQTDRFPTATLVLAQPVELGALPAVGEEVSLTRWRTSPSTASPSA